MMITLNGDLLRVPEASTVTDLLAQRPADGVAVALNGEVVPRSAHPTVVLAEGDLVEIVTAVQGG